MGKRLEVRCPCCRTTLVVDADKGDILAEERPKIGERVSFEDALEGVRSGADRRERAFDEAFDKTRRSGDLLSAKFEEARKKAARDPSKKPPNPFDLD